MFKKFWYNILVVVLSVLILSSCSDYQKILKSSDYDLKLKTALELYENKDYARAESLFEELIRIYNGQEEAEQIFYYYAQCYYGLKDYPMAGYYFKQFADNYALSQWAEECNFLNAYCLYLESPSPKLDQTSTNQAIDEFILFIRKFPSSEYVPQCNDLIDEMRDKIVSKSYMNAKLYYDMDQYKASITALNNSIEDFPETKYKEELLFLILKSSYKLASNSVIARKNERYQATIDYYFALIDEFPESKYSKEAIRYYENSKLELNN